MVTSLRPCAKPTAEVGMLDYPDIWPIILINPTHHRQGIMGVVVQHYLIGASQIKGDHYYAVNQPAHEFTMHHSSTKHSIVLSGHPVDRSKAFLAAPLTHYFSVVLSYLIHYWFKTLQSFPVPLMGR